MTAHRQKPTITPERVAWFAAYYARNPSWGTFHVCLDDGNYWCESIRSSHELTAEEIEAADWFDTLTPSQRKRLGDKAEALAYANPKTGAVR